MMAIPHSAGELSPVKGGRAVAVCKTDKRSASAAVVLREAGFDADVLRGGMEAWNKAFLPVERDASEKNADHELRQSRSL